MLEVRKLTKCFGSLIAVNKVDFYIRQGEIVGLVGPNGSGKTTLLNLISGIYQPDAGTINFLGEEITKLKPHQICRRGIGRTLQTPQSFPELTVLQNVMISMLFSRTKTNKKAMEILNFLGFPEKKFHALAKNLNTIELKRLQLARALATNPKLLLLDEVTTGLNPAESVEAVKLIKKIRDNGITILMIEHVMRTVMEVSDRIIVLHNGKKIAEGRANEIANDSEVIRCYLGKKVIM